MVRKASDEIKRGRPPAFDRSEVVTAATEAFWRKGFAETSLSDLETATGVDRSTIYNSFGGKRGLYNSATDLYLSEAEDSLFRPLTGGSSGVADIVAFLDLLAGMLDSSTIPQGCLIVNDIVSPTDENATNRYLGDLEGGLLAALNRSAELGETDPTRTSARARLVTAAVLGINLVHGGKADPATSETLIAGLRSEVASWA